MLSLTQVNAFGWPNSYRLANPHIELVVTTDIGPRLVRFGAVGGPNLLGLDPALQGQTGGDAWQPYGGHRLWQAPETLLTTYAPDNAPAKLEQLGDRVRVTGPVEPTTGLQKVLDLQLAPDAPRLEITHRIHNHSRWPLRLAPWALTVVAPGGTAVLALAPRRPHGPDTLVPDGQLTLWPYTDLADPRWTWGPRYLLARQDPAQAAFQKIGLAPARAVDAWLAYVLNGQALVKAMDWDPRAEYPDRNTPLQIFVNASILELETLGPLADVPPDGCVEHGERWLLLDGIPALRGDADVAAHLAPRVEAWLGAGT